MPSQIRESVVDLDGMAHKKPIDIDREVDWLWPVKVKY